MTKQIPYDLIPASDLPRSTPGAFDSVVGVDESTGAARRFPMPVTGAPKAYVTRADLPASASEGTAAYVNNDPAPANNGLWAYLDGAWVKSADRVGAIEVSIETLSGRNMRLTHRVEELESRGNLQAEAEMDAFIGPEQTALGFDASVSDLSRCIKRVIAGRGTSVSVDEYLPTLHAAPKLVTAPDGSLRWSPHNLCPHSEDFTQSTWAKTNATVTKGHLDSEGRFGASMVAATSPAGASVRRSIGSTFSRAGRWHTAQFVVRTGTSGWAYIQYQDGATRRAWFDLSIGAVGTVDSGLEASIHTNTPSGVPLERGYYRIVVSAVIGASALQVACGPSESDGAVATTLGATIYMHWAMVHYGRAPAIYYPNATAIPKFGAAWDYSLGEARLLVEPQATYISRYGDDLTQSVWTKSNVAVALDSVGPHGEPCSRLTATSANGTVTQSVSGATATQWFSAYVRRKTGSGTVSITTNGTDWTDISPPADRFERVLLAGGANPTIGFRLAVSGDEIDVALAVNSLVTTGTNAPSSPVPLYAENVTRSSDSMTMPLDWAAAPDGFSAYVELNRPPAPGFADDNTIRIGNGNWSQYARMGCIPATGLCSLSVHDGSSNTTHGIYTPSPGEKMEISMRVAANSHAISINGEPTGHSPGMVGIPDVQQIQLVPNMPALIRRFLFVARPVATDDLREWKYSGRIRNRLLAARIVAADSGLPGTDMNREPTILVLSDDGSTAHLAVFYHQSRIGTIQHPEAPYRIMQRNYRYDRETNLLISTTAQSVILQMPEWADSLGHLQSPVTFVVPSGPHKGRVVLLVTKQDSASGTFADDNRCVYVMVNDQGGAPTGWGPLTKLFDANALGYTRLILSPTNDVVMFPPNHPHAPGRVAVMMTVHTALAGSIYSDTYGGPDGTDWHLGTPYDAGNSANEPSLAMWPNGTLVSTVRTSSEDFRIWATSDDAVEFDIQGQVPNWVGSTAAAATLQLDPSGAANAYGVIAMSRPERIGTVGRSGTRIDFATDDTLEFRDPIYPYSRFRYMGYSSMRAIFGGTRLALAVEGGTRPFNFDNTSHLCILDAEGLV